MLKPTLASLSRPLSNATNNDVNNILPGVPAKATPEQQAVMAMTANDLPPNLEELLRKKEPIKIELESINIGETPGGHVGINAHYTGGASVSAGIKVTIGGGLSTASFLMQIDIPLSGAFFKTLATVARAALPYALLAAAVIGGGLFIYQNYWKHKVERTVRHIKRHLSATNSDLLEFNNWLIHGANFLQSLYFNPKFLTNIPAFEKLIESQLQDIIKDIDHRKDYAYDHDGFGAHNAHMEVEQAISQAWLNLKAEIKLAEVYLNTKTAILQKYQSAEINTLLARINELKAKKNLTHEEAAELALLRDNCIRKCLASNREILSNHSFLFDNNLGTCYKLPAIQIKPPFEPREVKGRHGHRTDKSDQAADLMATLKEAYDEFVRLVEAAAGDDAIQTAKNAFIKKLNDAVKALKNIEIKGMAGIKTAYDYYFNNINEMKTNVTLTWRSIKNVDSAAAPKFSFPSIFDLPLTKETNEFIVAHREKTLTELTSLAKELTKKPMKQGEVDGLNCLISENLCTLLRENKFDEASAFVNDMGSYQYREKRVKNANSSADEKNKGKREKTNLLPTENKDEALAAIAYCREHQNEPVKYWANLCEPLSEDTKSTDPKNITNSFYVQDYARNATLLGILKEVADLTPTALLSYAKAIDKTIKPEGLKWIFEAIKIRAIDLIPMMLLAADDPKKFLQDLKNINPNCIDQKLQQNLEEAIDFFVTHKNERKEFWIIFLKTARQQKEQAGNTTEEDAGSQIKNQIARHQVFTLTHDELSALSIPQLMQQIHNLNAPFD